MEHERGQVRATKALLPVEVVYKQEYDDYSLARKVELKLKDYKRKDFLEKVIKDGYFKSV